MAYKDRKKANKVSRDWNKAHPERVAEISRKYMFGITPEEFDLKIKNQKNRCAICGRKEAHRSHWTGKLTSLSVDHDHDTGKVRDLLCRNCNRVLGFFDDNIILFEKVIQYLKKHKG